MNGKTNCLEQFNFRFLREVHPHNLNIFCTFNSDRQNMIDYSIKVPISQSENIQLQEEVFFSPSSIVAIFNAATVTKEEKKIINVRGIFKKTGTLNYSGYYYNRLKDEASDNYITLVTSALMHNQIEDNKTIEFKGFITRKTTNKGSIEIIINLIELLSERVNKFSAEESKKILLINKKVDIGFKDLDALIKNKIFNNKQISIKVILGKAGIIDSDIKKGMEEAIALYDIEYHRISLSSPEQIINKIESLDVPGTDLICVARGGGDNLNVFDDLDICESILDRKTMIASAIGHAENITLFEKLSDKKFITPTQFGNYLKEIYNSTVEEFEQSKAKLAKDITTQLSANYGKQIQNLNDQLVASKTLYEKTILETNKNHAEQLLTLSNKLKSFEELGKKTTEEKANLHLIEVKNLKKQILDLTNLHQIQVEQLNNLQTEKMKSLNDQIQILQNQQSQKDKLIQQANDLASSYQKQLQAAQLKTEPNIGAIIIAVIIGIIIGLILMASL
jgi:hypothetical protein